MDNTTQLFIRACKSKNPEKRINSVYRRFYTHHSDADIHIINILSRICDMYLKLRVVDVISEISPEKAWLTCNGEYNYNKACLSVLTSKIRLSEVKVFNGLSKPLMFKN